MGETSVSQQVEDTLVRVSLTTQEDEMLQRVGDTIVVVRLRGKTEVAVNCEKIVVLSSVEYPKQNF